jgi:hypothetical protein
MMDYPQHRIPMSRLPRIIRIAGIGIGLALVLAYCIEWLAGPTLVIFEWDSGGYVHIGLILNQGADLDVRSDRTFGYPLFLALVLRLSASFVHVPTAQMLFVAGAALLAAIAISVAAPAESRNSVAMALLQAGLSVLAVVGLLSYQPLTNAAHELIPEALYTFLATAALLLTSLVLLQRYPPPILVGLYFVGTLVSTYAYYVKPHWGAAMLFTWTAMTFGLIAATWKMRRGSIILPGIALAGSIVLPLCFAVLQNSLDERSPYARTFGPLTLLCNHANLIAPIIDTVVVPPDSAARIRGVLEKTAAGGPKGWNVLGLNGDYCIYETPITEYLGDIKGGREAMRRFMLRAFYAGVLNDPGAYAAKVIRQIRYALQNPFPNISQLRGGNPEIYRNIFDGNKTHWGTVIIPTASSLQGHTPRPLMTGIPVIDAFAPWLLQFTNRHAGIVWSLIPILLLSTGLRILWTHRIGDSVWSVLPVPLVGGVYLSSTVVVALAHTFDISRYREAIAPLAVVFMAVVVLHLMWHVMLFARRVPVAIRQRASI